MNFIKHTSNAIYLPAALIVGCRNANLGSVPSGRWANYYFIISCSTNSHQLFSNRIQYSSWATMQTNCLHWIRHNIGQKEIDKKSGEEQSRASPKNRNEQGQLQFCHIYWLMIVPSFDLIGSTFTSAMWMRKETTSPVISFPCNRMK